MTELEIRRRWGEMCILATGVILVGANDCETIPIPVLALICFELLRYLHFALLRFALFAL